MLRCQRTQRQQVDAEGRFSSAVTFSRLSPSPAHRPKSKAALAPHRKSLKYGRGDRIRVGASARRSYQLWAHLPDQRGTEKADPRQHQDTDAERGAVPRWQTFAPVSRRAVRAWQGENSGRPKAWRACRWATQVKIGKSAMSMRPKTLFAISSTTLLAGMAMAAAAQSTPAPARGQATGTSPALCGRGDLREPRLQGEVPAGQTANYNCGVRLIGAHRRPVLEKAGPMRFTPPSSVTNAPLLRPSRPTSRRRLLRHADATRSRAGSSSRLRGRTDQNDYRSRRSH